SPAPVPAEPPLRPEPPVQPERPESHPLASRPPTVGREPPKASAPWQLQACPSGPRPAAERCREVLVVSCRQPFLVFSSHLSLVTRHLSLVPSRGFSASRWRPR